jgi:polysaccharide chain length determinant protein (PEP-CTERM system associated)
VNPLVNQVFDEVRGTWRFRWLALATAAVICAGGWVMIFSLPDRYQAEASVFVDTSTSLKPALQGLMVEEDVDSQLNFVRQSLLAGPQLQRVARAAGVLPSYAIDPRMQEEVLADMGRRIDISVRSANGHEEDSRTAGNIYRIVYLDRNRARALRVVQILLDTFVNETLGGKREGSENTQQFLEVQIQDYEKRLRAAEDRLAQFKARHLGLMPTEQGGYFAQLQHEQSLVSDLKTKLAEAQSRRVTLTRQLHGDVAVAAASGGDAGRGQAGSGAGFDTLSRIDEAQQHLDELLLRFTDQHPDVIAARQTLQDLKTRRAAEIESLKQGDASAAASSRASSNPVYQSVQLALNQSDVDIADLNTELMEHESKVTELRRFLDTAPQVEAEFAQLNRDYDVNKAQYSALLASLQKARLGERADNAGSIRFEVVQPPTSGLRPVWPIRPALLAGTLLAAIAAGAALAYGLHYLRPVVTSGATLATAVGAPILGTVSLAFPQRARQKRRRDVVQISAAASCLLMAFIIVVFLSLQGYRLSLTVLKQMVGS